MALRELSLFAGAGGGILGSLLLGWRTVCAVEIDPYCRSVLLQRQIDGALEPFPVWDDIRTFDSASWCGHVDVISGGFPCQGISSAGKRLGLADSRSSLVFEMLHAINVIRPRFVLAENSPLLRTNGLGAILEALDSMGYDAQWGVLGARHVGANHHRKRMWVVAADTNRRRKRNEPINAEMERTQTAYGCAKKGGHSDADCSIVRKQPWRCSRAQGEEETVSRIANWWGVPRFAGVDDGGTNRMDRVRATGNMQVPAVVALAWEILKP